MKSLSTLFVVIPLFVVSMFAQYPKPGSGSSGGGGGGGAAVTSLTELTDLKITRTSATVLTIAAGKGRIGEVVFSYPEATVTLSTPSASSTADIRVDSTGALTVVNPGATLATCNANCVVTATPLTTNTTVRIGTATYSSGTWDVSGITEQRTIVGRDLLAAGANISITTDAAGKQTIGSTAAAGLKSITVFDPVTGDSGRIQFEFPSAVTITRISCSVKAATSATINLDERAEATPDTSGTAVLTSGLACDTDSAASTTFSNADIAANVPVSLTISAVSGTPDTLRVHIEYTVN